MQILISVKNLEEAMLAFAEEVDVIDLKDPSLGAVGALDLATTRQILHAINGRATVSATVGENHTNLDSLMSDIQARIDLGVDIVKIAISTIFAHSDFFTQIRTLTLRDSKLVALFFADVIVETQLLNKLKEVGFYGAMLDTQNKQRSLLNLLPKTFLEEFVDLCKKNQLISGLAGSLKPQDIEALQNFNPTFIGFRGGVCENEMRNSTICTEKIQLIKNMLPKHNKIKRLARKSLVLALHSM